MPIAHFSLRPQNIVAEQFMPLKPHELDALVASVHASLALHSAAGELAGRS